MWTSHFRHYKHKQKKKKSSKSSLSWKRNKQVAKQVIWDLALFSVFVPRHYYLNVPVTVLGFSFSYCFIFLISVRHLSKDMYTFLDLTQSEWMESFLVCKNVRRAHPSKDLCQCPSSIKLFLAWERRMNMHYWTFLPVLWVMAQCLSMSTASISREASTDCFLLFFIAIFQRRIINPYVIVLWLLGKNEQKKGNCHIKVELLTFISSVFGFAYFISFLSFYFVSIYIKFIKILLCSDGVFSCQTISLALYLLYLSKRLFCQR